MKVKRISNLKSFQVKKSLIVIHLLHEVEIGERSARRVRIKRKTNSALLFSDSAGGGVLREGRGVF